MIDRSNAPLVYAALGGAGEVGMNCYLYGIGPAAQRRWIVVDLGIGFGDMETTPGIELILPDVSFLKGEKGRIEAIFLTHGHEDHVGAIPHLWSTLKVPVYARAFTAEVVRRKMAENGHDAKMVRQVGVGERIKAGPFEVEFLNITHSIPEASMLAIRTPEGTIVHTGDFKLDPAPGIGQPYDLAPLERLGDEGVLALACDSTNVFLDGVAGSEAEVTDNVLRLIREAEGAVAATSFASNVSRVRTLALAAEQAERSIVLVGRAMKRMVEIAVETGYLTDFPKVISEDRIRDIPARHIFYLVTGSQGEARAAMARIASGSHPTVSLTAGDTVLFSSRSIPGNEAGIHRLYNRLSALGVRVIDGDQERIHVSGHARRGDLQRVYAATRPRVAVPLHGEHRHLVEHARWARVWGAGQAIVAPNGSVIRLDGNQPGEIEQVETGRVYLDGTVQVGALDGVIRDRLKLARQGQIVVAVVVDEEGVLLADPDVRCIGTPKQAPGWPAPLEDLVADAVDDALEGAQPKAVKTDQGVEEVVGRAVRGVVGRYWGKKPVLTVMVTRLEE